MGVPHRRGKQEGEMAFLISDVYSVTPSKEIKWYLYVFASAKIQMAL
jgi:hypothetical protein